MSEPDPNMFTAPFQLTKSMHRDVYPAVDPKNPKLSAKGKVVLITGASGGLGSKIAVAWSDAGADGIVLVGRNASTLEDVAKGLKSKTIVATGTISIADDAATIVKKAVSAFGHVNVLVNVAGSMNQGCVAGEVDPNKWWADFESNVKGTYNMVHYFINATEGRGTVVNLVSLGASFLVPGISSYSASKLAVIKLGECLDIEQPGLRVFSVHPGIVEAEGGRGMVVPNFTPFAKDKAALTGGLTLYLAHPIADYLRGGLISVNWDVEELEEHKAELQEKKLIKLGFLNGTLAPGGYPWAESGEKEDGKQA